MVISTESAWDPARQAAQDRGLWLIIPWMPFYTGDGGGLPAVKRIEHFAAMLPGFLDIVEVKRCPILSSSLATPYAFAALTGSPERFSGVVLAGMAVPLTEIEDRSTINPAWRAPMELGQRFPRFFELFARAMFRLALRGEFHQYFDRLFEDSPADLAVLRDPGVAATLRRAAENRPDRFGAAMAHGFVIMTTDWSRWMDFAPGSVRLVHGADDVVAKPQHIADFARKYDIATVGPVSGLGGFSLFQDPDLVLAEVASL